MPTEAYECPDRQFALDRTMAWRVAQENVERILWNLELASQSSQSGDLEALNRYTRLTFALAAEATIAHWCAARARWLSDQCTIEPDVEIDTELLEAS